MGMSARAQLCYGVPFPEEGFDFPWGSDDPESWWREENGYQNPHVVDWGHINRSDPVAKANVDGYFDYQKEWDKTHPSMPFEEVFHGSCDFSLSILAVPGSTKKVEWGDTLDISVILPPPVNRSRFQDFLEKYFPETLDDFNSRPRWIMSAYYG